MHGTDSFNVISFFHCRNEKKFFKVQCKQTKRLYTMEVLPNNHLGGDFVEIPGAPCADNSSNIKCIRSCVDFPFCMQLRFFFKTSQKVYYILDYVGEENLVSLAQECDGGFPESTVLLVAAELTIALNGLHVRGLTYGELSLDTVMVDSDGHVVLWREFLQKQYWDACECVCSVQDTNCDNPDHNKRQQFESRTCDDGSSEIKLEARKDDWRALGVVLHTLLVGQLSEKRTSHEGTWFPESVTTNTKDLVHGLLEGTIDTFEAVERHCCFANMDWNKVKSKSLSSPLKTILSSKADSSMSHYRSKHLSSHNISSAAVFGSQQRRSYSTTPTFSRSSSSSSDLFPFSLNANLKHGLADHYPLSRTPTETSIVGQSSPTETSIVGQSSTRRLGITRNYHEDRLTTSWTSQVDISSNMSKPMPAKSATRINYFTPSCLSAPPSPNHSVSTSPSLKTILDGTSLPKSDSYFKNQSTHVLASLPNTRATLRRGQSSTDIPSLALSSVPSRETPDQLFLASTLNRSRSYTNIKKASCDVQNETEQSVLRPGENKQTSDSNESTKGEQHMRRSSAWTRIPTFEEFRAMRSSGKIECDGGENRDMNNNDDNGSNTNIDNEGRLEVCVPTPEFSNGQTVEKKGPSHSSNPVIQDLLVKYGLNKTPSIIRRPFKDNGSKTAALAQTDVTNSKQRLLSMLDEFLTNKDKEITLRTRKSTSEMKNYNKSFGERRTSSSARMRLLEDYESRKCLKRDVGGDLESSENISAKSSNNSDKHHGNTSEESLATLNIAGNLSGNSNNSLDGTELLKSDLTEETDDTNGGVNGSRAKAEEKLTKGSVSERQSELESRTLAEQQPDISLTVSSSKKSPTVASTGPHEEFIVTSRRSAKKNRNVSNRRRKSSEKCGSKERKTHRRTLSEESQRPNRDDSSLNVENIGKSHGIQRTSGLLSLAASVKSYDEPGDKEELEPRNEKSSRQSSRNSTRSDSSLNTEHDTDFPSEEIPRNRGSSYLSVVSDRDLSRAESSSSNISRGSSFVSNISTDSGSRHVDFEDSDDDVFNSELRVVHEISESEIKRNDSGLGDEIGVTSRLRKRWEDIVDDSSRQWSIVASSARCWREMTTKKRERRLQEQKYNEGRKISHERKISGDRSCNSIDCPDCGRPCLVDKDKPSEGPKRCLICYKCQSHRVERKEAIIELVQTEINCGNDFQILKEEFFSPMQFGGIISPENLAKIFLNVQELLDVSLKFCKKIETSMEECIGKNDEEFCHMRVGKIFVDNVEFFQAYELYCSKQPEAFSLLESLQKKNEVLRVFLNITCRENPKCRKMDINSFLLAPVQRLMKYPLLLNRIRKATSLWHGDREDLKLAQRKVEDQIAKINSLTKSSDVKTKKFQSNLGSFDSVDSTRLKKLACDVLTWTMDEIQILMHGVLKVRYCEFGALQSWTKRVVNRNIETHLLFCVRGHNEPILVDSEDDDSLQFPQVSEVSDASLLLLKRKNNGKFTLFRDEIKLRDCVVHEEAESDSFGLIHMGQETFIFTTRTSKDARRWVKHLRLQTKAQGKWRLRRKALANIMLKAS